MSAFKDLLGNPGLDQDCLATCLTTAECMMHGCACQHNFQGWHDFTDDEGRACGGTTVCTKCGMDAMTYSLWTGI